MSNNDKTKDLHETQTPKEKGERIEELGQRVIPPPPLDKVIGDATKGQRVPPPPPSSSPEVQQIAPQVTPSSQETPQTLPPQTPSSQSVQETPTSPPSGDSSQNNSNEGKD